MADLFLTWEEAQGELLPHYCISCAAPATEWADWRIRHSRRIFSIDYTFVDVTLPVCPSHRKLNWFLLHRVVAREVHEDGVLLSHISPGFVQAVWDYRDQLDRGEISAPALASPRWDSEQDYEPNSLPRRHDRRERYSPPSAGLSAVKIVFLVLAALFFAPFVLLMMCGLLALLI